MVEVASRWPVSQLTATEQFTWGAVWTRRVWWLALLLTVLFVTLDHNVSHLTRVASGLDEEAIMAELADAAATGSARRKIVLLGFAVWAAICLVMDEKKIKFHVQPVLVFLFSASLAWILASNLWSVDRDLSVKRTIVLACMSVGAFYLAAVVSPRELCGALILTCLGFVALGLAMEVKSGVFRPWDGEYRFSGTAHANVQATYCGLLALGLAILYPTVGGRGANLLLLIAALGLTYLTRSRMSLAAMLMAIALTRYFLLPSRWRVPVFWAGLSMAAVPLLLFSLLGRKSLKILLGIALLGRGHESTGTLNGRTPLWAELMEYVSHRPWQGHGFSAFWRPEIIETLTEHQEWAMNSAHSIYIQLLLEVGWIGMFLVIATGLAAMIRCWWLTRERPDYGLVFMMGVLIYGFLQGCLEAHGVDIGFIGFVNGVIVLRMALFQPGLNQQSEETPPTLSQEIEVLAATGP